MTFDDLFAERYQPMVRLATLIVGANVVSTASGSGSTAVVVHIPRRSHCDDAARVGHERPGHGPGRHLGARRRAASDAVRDRRHRQVGFELSDTVRP
jgi:hypothetical protein